MHNNLIELIEYQFDDDVIEQLSQLLGQSIMTTKTAVMTSVVGVLNEILELNITDNDSALLKTLRNQSERLLDTLAIKLGSGQHSTLISIGTVLLKSLMGEEKHSNLVTTLSETNGLDHESMQSVLGLTAPVIFSSIRRIARTEEMDKPGLQNYLDGQKDYVATMAQTYMGNHLPADDQAQQIHQKSSLFNNLAWLAILIGVAYSAYNFLVPQDSNNSNTMSQNETTPIPLTDSDNDGRDTANISNTQRELIDLLTHIGNTFIKVKDRETAKYALPIVQETTKKLDMLSVEYKGLPESETKRINTVVRENINALKSTKKDFESNPEISLILNNAINKLVDTLKRFTNS
jgi:hypothetical protein